MISSGKPTEPTVSKTPTHLMGIKRDIADNQFATYLIEKVLSSEIALRFPQDVGEVQGASWACNLAISGTLIHHQKNMRLDIQNKPAGSSDFPSFWYAIKMSAKWSISILFKTPIAPCIIRISTAAEDTQGIDLR